MLLTKYDRKLHEKTLWEEGREEGKLEGYASRQGEVDELKTLMLFKDDALLRKDKELADMKKKIAELEAKVK